MRKIYFLIVKNKFNNPSIREICFYAIQRYWYWSISKATTKVRTLNIVKIVGEKFSFICALQRFY